MSVEAAEQAVAADGRLRRPPLNGKAFGSLRMDRRATAIVVTLLAVASCLGRASITIRNESGVEVQDLHVQGRCFAEVLGVLESGASKSLRVKPCGESGIRTQFTTGQTNHETPEVGYIEASSFYSVTLVIGPDFSVHQSAR